MDFDDVIHMRKSVRRYSSQFVEPDQIHRVLEAARLAPSWANKQCWHFVVVKDADNRKRLTDAAGAVNNWIKDAPIIIAACADPQESGHRGDIDYYLVDTAIAMEHLVLAAANEGLATCWLGYFNEPMVKAALNIPEEIRVLALSPLGYPIEQNGVKIKMSNLKVDSHRRKDLDEIFHYDEW